MMTLYENPGSGNGYKVRLLLAHLGLSFRLVSIDILKSETQDPTFLALNPNGRVPVAVFEDGFILPESNAILYYVAQGTPYLPNEGKARATTLQWCFFEQYSHEPFISIARLWRTRLPYDTGREQRLPELMERGYHALKVMDDRLSRTAFLVGDQYTIADISLYAYTHTAEEGGFHLSSFPAIGAWLARVERQVGFQPNAKA